MSPGKSQSVEGRGDQNAVYFRHCPKNGSKVLKILVRDCRQLPLVRNVFEPPLADSKKFMLGAVGDDEIAVHRTFIPDGTLA